MTSMLQLVPSRRSFLSLIPEMDLFDRFFHDFSLPSLFDEDRVLVPAFDVSETEREYVITGEIPGIDVKDLDVTLVDGRLTIKGEKKHEDEQRHENYHMVERHYGSFERSFWIPDNVKGDELDATYKDGILRLALPKAEVSKAKKIEVKEKKTGRKVKTKKA